MSNQLLIHASGLAALALNAVALVCTCERRLRLRAGVAGMVWALNNFLLGAHTAAVLNVLSAGRTATSAATLVGRHRARRAAFFVFVAITLAIGAATWSDWRGLVMTSASLISTHAVFNMTGRPLRLVMLLVSVMWLTIAWTLGSWEQVAANVLSAVACGAGACRASRARGPDARRQPRLRFAPHLGRGR